MNKLIFSRYRFADIQFIPDNSYIKNAFGFSGSMSHVLIPEKGIPTLYVDGRYILQAKQETNINVSLGSYDNNNIDGDIYCNPFVVTIGELEKLNSKSIKLSPLVIEEKIAVHTISIIANWEYFISAEDNINAALQTMQDHGCDAFFIGSSAKNSILLNMRIDGVISNSTILPCHTLITLEGSTPKVLVFTNQHLINPEALHIDNVIVEISDIYSVEKYVSSFNCILLDELTPIAIMKMSRSHKIVKKYDKYNQYCKQPINLYEEHKTRYAHGLDSLIKTRIIGWLYKNLYDPNIVSFNITERDIANKIEEFNCEVREYISPSFGSIVATGTNSSQPHYQASDISILNNSLLLIDTGSQYTFGTTDTTRTIIIGKPEDKMKHIYTAVLKGHIQLAKTRFEPNTRSCDLDKIARSTVEKFGYSYNHATGHAVAQFGNVHDSAYTINTQSIECVKPNTVLSIEPGAYLPDKYGVRIENIFITKIDSKGLMYFNPLTYIPFDFNLIDFEMIAEDELEWINNYNAYIKAALPYSLIKNMMHHLERK